MSDDVRAAPLGVEPLTDDEWFAWHEVDDQLNLMLLRHGVRPGDVDMTEFRRALDDYREKIRASGRASGGPAEGEPPPDLRQRREKLGEMLRDLEVIVSNYHSDGWRTRNESDAELFAEWQKIRGALFDALTDMTAEIARLRALVARHQEGDK